MCYACTAIWELELLTRTARTTFRVFELELPKLALRAFLVLSVRSSEVESAEHTHTHPADNNEINTNT